MAPPKASRKGKKSWRKNIDVSKVEEHIEASTLQERRGPATETLADSQLFFVDKSAADGAAAAAALGPVRRRRPEPKVLHSHQVIAQAHLAVPVPFPKQTSKTGLALARLAAEERAVKAAKRAAEAPVRNAPPPTFRMQKVRGKQAGVAPLEDLWGSGGDLIEESLIEGPSGGIAPSRKQPKRRRAAPIQAVEVDAAGCSYNPDPEQHQDSLAELVAWEMRKVIKRQLEPTAPPPFQVLGPGETAEDPNELQVDADAESSGDEDAAGAAAASARRRKTVKDRNREQRCKDTNRDLEVKRQIKRQRRDLDALPQLEAGVAEELQEQAERRVRRKVVKAEKAACQPPKLGKVRYQAAATQVLTTDDVTGCLRQLPPCAMMLSERFNSLQKRGLVEPRRIQMHRTPRKLLEFERGARPERAAEMQREIEAMQHGRRLASRKKDRLGAPADAM